MWRVRGKGIDVSVRLLCVCAQHIYHTHNCLIKNKYGNLGYESESVPRQELRVINLHLNT